MPQKPAWDPVKLGLGKPLSETAARVGGMPTPKEEAEQLAADAPAWDPVALGLGKPLEQDEVPAPAPKTDDDGAAWDPVALGLGKPAWEGVREQAATLAAQLANFSGGKAEAEALHKNVLDAFTVGQGQLAQLHRDYVEGGLSSKSFFDQAAEVVESLGRIAGRPAGETRAEIEGMRQGLLEHLRAQGADAKAANDAATLSSFAGEWMAAYAGLLLTYPADSAAKALPVLEKPAHMLKSFQRGMLSLVGEGMKWAGLELTQAGKAFAIPTAEEMERAGGVVDLRATMQRVNDRDTRAEDHALWRAGEGFARGIDLMFPNDPELAHSFWLTKVPEGGGSFAAFATLGILTRGRNALTTAANKTFMGKAGNTVERFVRNPATWLAAGTQAARAYEETGYYGLEESERTTAARAAMPSGALQVANVIRIAGRWDRATGGAMSNRFARWLAEGAVSGLNEFMVEGGGELAYNAGARVLWDHDRDLLANVFQNAAVGGVSSGIFGFIMEAVRGSALRGRRLGWRDLNQDQQRLVAMERARRKHSADAWDGLDVDARIQAALTELDALNQGSTGDNYMRELGAVDTVDSEQSAIAIEEMDAAIAMAEAEAAEAAAGDTVVELDAVAQVDPVLRQRESALAAEVADWESQGARRADSDLSDRDYNRYREAQRQLEDVRREIRRAAGGAVAAPASATAEDTAAVQAERAAADAEIFARLEKELSPAGRELLKSTLEQAQRDADARAVEKVSGVAGDARASAAAQRRAWLKRMADKPIWRWSQADLQAGVRFGWVKATRESARRQRVAEADARMTAKERKARMDELADMAYRDMSREDLEFLAGRGDEGAVTELIRLEEQAEVDGENDPSTDIAKVIVKLGGLPDPAAMRRAGETDLLGELEALMKTTGRTKKVRETGARGKRRKGHERKVQPKGLWPKGKIDSLDKIAEVLREDHGFSWIQTPADLIATLEERYSTDKPVYPDWANMGRDDVSFSLRRPWDKEMDVDLLGTTRGLKDQPGYAEAKRGDWQAAMNLAVGVLSGKRARIREWLGGLERPVIVPVLAVEALGKNKIPLALAETIAATAGVEATVSTDILQTQKAGHTGAGARRRLLSPEFSGEVEAGRDYVIVDDVVTSGSTVAALRQHIEEQGGRVARVIAAGTAFSPQTGSGKTLSIRQDTLDKLRTKFNSTTLNEILNEAGIADNVESLTNSQGRYLLSFGSLDGLRRKILEGRYESRIEENAEVDTRESRQTRLDLSRQQESGDQVRLDEAAIASHLDQFAGEWTGDVTVAVVQSVADLPPRYHQTLSKDDLSAAEGLYDSSTNKVWLVADNLPTLERAEAVLLHEIVGHRGMRAVLGAGHDDFMRRIYGSRADSDAMRKIERLYNLDAGRDRDNVNAASEYVARLAEGGVEDPGIWQRVLSTVRSWLRDIGFAVQISDADIAAMLARAKGELDRMGRSEAQATRAVIMRFEQLQPAGQVFVQESRKRGQAGINREILAPIEAKIERGAIQRDDAYRRLQQYFELQWQFDKTHFPDAFRRGRYLRKDEDIAQLDRETFSQLLREVTGIANHADANRLIDEIEHFDRGGKWRLPPFAGNISLGREAEMRMRRFGNPSRREARVVAFSKQDLDAQLADLRERLEALDADLAEARADGRTPPPQLLSQKSRLQRDISRVMALMETTLPQGGAAPAGADGAVRRNRSNSKIESATLSKEAAFTRWVKGVGNIGKSFVGLIPEIGTDPRFAQFEEGYRKMMALPDVVQRQAQKDVAHVLEPISKLGRDTVMANAMKRWRSLVARRERLTAAGKTVSPALDKALAKVEDTLADSPWYLFQQAVLYRDLWYRSMLQNSSGEPLQMPGDMSVDMVRDRLANIHEMMDASPHADAIRESLRRHYAMVETLQKELVDHGHTIPADLRNPLYFPHYVLDNFSGVMDQAGATTDPEFRAYLQDPQGSTKLVETDYLKALYHHVARVRLHNGKQDIIEREWKPYDISAARQAELEAEAAEGGYKVPADAWTREDNIPEGYELHTVEKSLPLRPALVIDPEVLMKATADMVESGGLIEKLRELGMEANLTTKELIDSMRVGLLVEKRQQWLVPKPVAEGLRGIGAREDAARAQQRAKLAKGIAVWSMKPWKWNILFNPFNYPRYEFNNTVTDILKIFTMDPGMVRKILPAHREVLAFFRGGEPSKELRAAFERGVIESVSAREVGQVKEFEDFANFVATGKLTLKRIKEFVTATTRIARWREGVFRYAKFLADVERMRNGATPMYGGAYWKSVEALDGIYDKAGLISRQSFIDYSAISLGGSWMRRYVAPFYSWIEGNARYHVNLFRNMADMVRAGKFDKATDAGALAARLSVASAIGMVNRMLMPYILIQLWNTYGGPAVGAWDEEDDLYSTLSAHDKRGLVIILGKDEHGETRIVRTPTALADILEWFGGNELAAMLIDYARGDATLEQVASDYRKTVAPALLNKSINSIRPEVKASYMLASRKDPFPDVTDQRTISQHDLWYSIISNMTDRTTGLVVRRLFDKEYYSPNDFPRWAQQTFLQVRRRNPDQWAYFEMRDKVDRWVDERAGVIDRQSGSVTRIEQKAVRGFRRAIFHADTNEAIRFYNLLLHDYGYTAEQLRAAMQAQNPLQRISKAHRREFYDSLTPRERQQLQRAYRYYVQIESARGFEHQLFPSSRASDNYRRQFMPRVDVLIDMINSQSRVTNDGREERAEQLLRQSL